MAYIRPIVLVYQEYANLSTPTTTADLPACIVGPCYHIIDETDNEELSFIGNYAATGVHAQSFPNNAPGAVVVAESVTVKLTDVVASLLSTNAIVSSVALNKLTFPTLPAGIAIGDIVDFYDGTTLVGTGYRVTQIDEANKAIFLNRNVGGTYTNPQIMVYRGVPDMYVSFGDEHLTVNVTNSTFDLAPLTVVIDGTSKVVHNAKMFVYYKALRTDLGHSLTPIYNQNDITGILGKTTPENPLAFGCTVALSNSNTVIYALAVNKDNLEGYTAAKDILENTSDVYAIVPLTQDIGILNMFKEHCVQHSSPEIGKWRITIGNTPLITTQTIVDSVGKLIQDPNNALTIIYDPSASFISSGVSNGDTLKVNASSYVVQSVISEDMVQATTSMSGTANVEYSYQIIRDLNRTEQAQNIAATSKSFGDRRFTHVWPDIAIIDNQEVSGVYLACAVAGAVAGLPPHQGFTNMSLAGITSVKHSGDYFNKDQIDIIAGGGTFVFLQDSVASAPRILQQLTTDMSTIEFRELSFVKNFDYICYMSKDVLDEFIGTYNVTPQTMATLSTAMRATLKSLMLSSLPKIGAPLLGFEIVSVNQLNGIRDRVEMYINLNLPYALNTIGLHLVSQ